MTVLGQRGTAQGFGGTVLGERGTAQGRHSHPWAGGEGRSEGAGKGRRPDRWAQVKGGRGRRGQNLDRWVKRLREKHTSIKAVITIAVTTGESGNNYNTLDDIVSSKNNNNDSRHSNSSGVGLSGNWGF